MVEIMPDMDNNKVQLYMADNLKGDKKIDGFDVYNQ